MNGKEIEPLDNSDHAADVADAQTHEVFDPLDEGHPGAIRLECLAEATADSGKTSEQLTGHL